LIAEFIRIKIIANPQVIAGYYFGSEAMMDHGGWTYRSASLYAWSAPAEGLFIFGLGLLFLFGMTRKKTKYLVIAYLSLAAWFTYIVLSHFFPVPHDPGV